MEWLQLRQDQSITCFLSNPWLPLIQAHKVPESQKCHVTSRQVSTRVDESAAWPLAAVIRGMYCRWNDKTVHRLLSLLHVVTQYQHAAACLKVPHCHCQLRNVPKCHELRDLVFILSDPTAYPEFSCFRCLENMGRLAPLWVWHCLDLRKSCPRICCCCCWIHRHTFHDQTDKTNTVSNQQTCSVCQTGWTTYCHRNSKSH